MIAVIRANPLISGAAISWCMAQLWKVIQILFMYRRLDVRRLMGAGGMPSSHSAVVCSCAVGTMRVYGGTSPVFALACVLAFIVMYDACNIRRAAGQHARVLNKIFDDHPELKPEYADKDLEENLGHTLPQVAVGALLGIGIGTLVSSL